MSPVGSSWSSGGIPPVSTISPSGSPVVETAPSRATVTYVFGSAMRNRCARRARPTSTSSSPVANGSSVPAWPALRTPSARRVASVRSCDVLPAGLSTRTRPSTLRTLQLGGDLLAQERDELVVRELGREAGRAPVTAAAPPPRDGRHVDAAVRRAQRDLLACAVAVHQLACERGDLRPLDRAEVVDDALGVALLRAGEAEVVAAEVGERDRVVVQALELRQRAAEQLELRVRHAFVQAPVDVVDVDAGGDQLGRHHVRARAGVLVHELAGVRDEPDVQRLGDLDRRRDAQRRHEVPHDLGRARRVLDDVVDRAEARVVVVMVDVEDVGVVALERLDRVAVDVAAVEEDDRALVEVVGRPALQPVEVEEAVLVGQRELVGGHEHDRVLAERAQDLVHPDERAERVAVGVLVREQDELRRRADLVEHLLARLDRDLRPERAHAGGASCSRSASTRAARSAVWSSSNWSSGVRLRRSSAATRLWRNPCADCRPASVASCSDSGPRTLTYTRAWRRSGLVLTSVTVTNPMRGSFSSCARASPSTCRIASSTRRILAALILALRHPRTT